MVYLSKLTKRLAAGRTTLLLTLLAACAGTEASTDPGATTEVGSVVLAPATAGLGVGRTVRLVAEVRDPRGSPLPDEAVSWSSADPTIAVVSTDGTVTALKEGETEIRGRARGKSGRSIITVSPTPVAEVVVSPTPTTVAVGAQRQLSATTLSSTDSVLTGRVVTWASNNTAVARVDASGVVTGLAAGSAVITATSETSIGSAAVDVTSPVVGAVTTLAVTGTSETTATLRFTEVDDGTGAPALYAVRFATPTITWGTATAVTAGTCQTPMSGTSIGAVRSCTVQGLSAGTAYQFQVVAFRGTFGTTAVYGPLSNVASGTTALTPVATVTLSPATASAAVGATATFSATLRDAAGNVLTGRSISWTSSNSAVATVSASGLATGVATGTASIRATSGGVTGIATLTVTAPTTAPVASVTVSPATASLPAGAGTQLSAVLRDAGGAVLSGRTVTWSSTNSAVATVNASGFVTAVAGGSATVRATSEGVTGSASITVQTASTGTPLFESTWSHLTGNSREAVSDNNRWPIVACGNHYEVLTVIPGSQVGFTETANVLQVQMRGASACGMLQRDDALPISTTHWGRFWVRNDENGTRNGHAAAYNNVHPNSSIQSVPWTRDARLGGGAPGAGQWRMQVGGTEAWPLDIWSSPPLQNGVWYRFEWMLEYVGDIEFRIWPRVYDAAGNLLYDHRHFGQNEYNGPEDLTLEEYYALDNGTRVMAHVGGAAGASAELARNFGIGNEGPANATDTRGYWYYAKFALSTTGWLGR